MLTGEMESEELVCSLKLVVAVPKQHIKEK